MSQVIPKLVTKNARIVSIVLVAWVVIGPVGSSMAKSRKVQDQPVMRVWIYDYAHVGKTDLGEAEGQAARIFATVGVRIAWTVFSQRPGTGMANSENSVADLFLRIFPASMARRCNYKAGTLGESVISPTAEGPLPGGTANVFYDRVEHISSLWGLASGEILGDAIAHELGHLLLGTRHSSQGIMKAPWTFQDLELAGRGNLRFLPIERKALQRAARSLHRNLPLTVAAQR